MFVCGRHLRAEEQELAGGPRPALDLSRLPELERANGEALLAFFRRHGIYHREALAAQVAQPSRPAMRDPEPAASAYVPPRPEPPPGRDSGPGLRSPSRRPNRSRPSRPIRRP
jgi:hypothetical protein